MPLSSIFHTAKGCKEHSCKINNKNIKTIFKPDNGFLDKNIEKLLFASNSYKICDCIAICKNDDLVIVEILCGKLTYREFKEKCEQLENCCKVITHQGLKTGIKKIVLLYQKLESNKKNPQLRKKLINPRICSIRLNISNDSTYDAGCI